jgi:hypothetical protein
MVQVNGQINSILGKNGLEKDLGDVCLADEIKVYINHLCIWPLLWVGRNYVLCFLRFERVLNQTSFLNHRTVNSQIMLQEFKLKRMKHRFPGQFKDE